MNINKYLKKTVCFFVFILTATLVVSKEKYSYYSRFIFLKTIFILKDGLSRKDL